MVLLIVVNSTLPSQMKQKMEKKLTQYKENLEKVASMIRDNTKTTFIAVCIAEYLSISETQRLLGELNDNSVHSSHIIVNQLLDPSVRTPFCIYAPVS